jgi:hypothetical protein
VLSKSKSAACVIVRVAGAAADEENLRAGQSAGESGTKGVMNWIDRNVFWVLHVSGALTCSMLLQALAPRFAVHFIFGEDIASTSGLLIARSWGAMVFVSGLLLIASAYHPEFRLPVLLNAIAGKLGFTLLVFASGRRYVARPAFAMALADLVMVALFAWYLAAR